jgi:hypothetical protein
MQTIIALAGGALGPLVITALVWLERRTHRRRPLPTSFPPARWQVDMLPPLSNEPKGGAQ